MVEIEEQLLQLAFTLLFIQNFPARPRLNMPEDEVSRQPGDIAGPPGLAPASQAFSAGRRQLLPAASAASAPRRSRSRSQQPATTAPSGDHAFHVSLGAMVSSELANLHPDVNTAVKVAAQKLSRDIEHLQKINCRARLLKIRPKICPKAFVH